MAYDAGTAFLSVIPSFAGVVTKITAEATEWGEVMGETFKATFESEVQDLKVGVELTGVPELAAEVGALTVDRSLEIAPKISKAASAAYLAELAALMGFAAAAADGAAGGGGGGGLLGALGWGGGLAGFAAFGSVLSLMGFGLEHFVITAIGLIGSAAAALAGGALLALGSLGVLGVGTLTDLGGIGQAAGDIKNVYTVLAQYQTAQQGLARQLPQTAAAQAALNSALAGFAPAAQSAVLAAALTASQFHWLYDQVTGTAEAIGAQILNQAMQVGELFLPTLGKYAALNMGIIQKDLQPLFSWLGTQGLGIFQQLEQIFTAHLPAAINALNQGIELLLKTISLVAPQTGNLMTSISNVLTYLNTPVGWTKWSTIVENLIATFDKWWGLLKQIFVTLYDLFAPNVGLGSSIVTTLTSMLKVLDKWLTSTTGMSALSTLFSVHKTEIMELLGFLGDLVAYGGQIMLQVIPPFVTLANVLLGIADTIMNTPILGTILAWAGAAVLLWKAMNLAAIYAAAVGGANGVIKVLNFLPGVDIAPLSTAATTFAGAVQEFSAAVARFAGETLETGLEGAGVLSAIMPLAAAAVVGTAIGLAIAPAVLNWLGAVSRQTSYVPTKGIDAGLYPADTSPLSPGGQGQGTTNWAWMFDNMLSSGPADAVRKWFKSLPGDIASWFSTLPGDFSSIWSNISTLTKNLIGNIGGWFKSLPGDIWGWIESIPGDFGKVWTGITKGAKNWLTGTLEPWFKGLPATIEGWLSGAGTWLLKAGENIITGLWDGMEKIWKNVTSWISGLAHVISSLKGPLDYDRVLLVPHGQAIMQGLGQGLEEGFQQSVAPRLADIAAKVGSVGVGAGTVDLGRMSGGSSVLATLQRIEAAIHAEGAIPTGAAVSSKVNAQLGNVIQQHARTVLQVARST